MDTVPYTGSALTPAPAVTYLGYPAIEGTDYSVVYTDNKGQTVDAMVNAGTYYAVFTGKSLYTGTKKVPIRILPLDIKGGEASLTKTSYVYDGSLKKPSAAVVYSGITLKEGKDYTITYKNNKNAGTAFAYINGRSNYTDSREIGFTITKAANPLKISAKKATVKYSKLNKKTQMLSVTKVIKFTKYAKDKKTYTLSSANKGKKSFKKYFKISKTTGKVTVKKGLKKGTYKVKVKVKAAGNNNYKASAVKTVTFTVRVK